MPFDYDKMFFRRQRNSDFSPWLEVVSRGNKNTFIQPTLSTTQDILAFPSEDDSDGWRLVSDDNIARGLIGDDKVQVAGVLDFVHGSNSITDTKIGLNTNLTGMTNYYTKKETDSSLAYKAPINNPRFTGTVSVNGKLV